jgi:hypothetical protein
LSSSMLLIDLLALPKEDLLHDFVLQFGGERQRKLSDSLTHPALAQHFGVATMAVVQCVIGPFQGFNIRNVLFHGERLCSPCPLSVKPATAGFVWELDVHVGGLALAVLQQFHALLSACVRLPLAKLSVEEDESLFSAARPLFALFSGDEIAQLAVAAPSDECTTTRHVNALALAEDIVQRSVFAVAGTERAWIHAFALVLRDSHHVAGLCALFALLEHSLRCVYVIANGNTL